MKKTLILPACALLAMALTSCQKPPPCPACPPPPPPPPVVDVKAEEEAIRALDAKWNEAIAAKDTEAVAAFYSSDAVMLPPGKDEKSGEAIKTEWAELWGMPNVSLTFTPSRIEVDKDAEMAVDVGTWQMSFDGPTGKVEDHGKYAQVWKKQDGAWKCAVDMYNSSMPPPAPPAAAPAK